MNLNTRFRLAGAAIVTAAVVGAATVGCTTSNGTVRPTGTKTGTFPYCAYTPVEDGVQVDEDQKVPCVLNDVREADKRNKVSKDERNTAEPSKLKTKTPSKSSSSRR